MAHHPGLDIQILPVERIHPFEDSVDLHAEPVALESISTIHNPFPVTMINDRAYVLLADSDRFVALVEAGLTQVPVQVCAPDTVSVVSETISLFGFGIDELRELTGRYPDDIMIASGTLTAPDGYMQAVLYPREGTPLAVHLRHATRVGCPGGLTRLFTAIESVGRYSPVFEHRRTGDPLLKGAPPAATLSLPSFGLADLRTAAISEELFPVHILRVLTLSRVLAIDFPVTVLISDISITEKQAFLEDLIALREQEHRTSVVEGRVYLLNR